MEAKTARLHSDDGRWLEITVQGDRASACVNGAKPFGFNFENLGYTTHGMGYQAWGEGSHFNVRQVPGGVVLEFQAPGDRCAALCRLTTQEMRETMERLDAPALIASAASMI